MGQEDLARGRTAYAERRWDVCVSALRSADADEPLSGDDLTLLGLSLYLTGEDQASAEVLERTHRLALTEERWAEAAETAFWYAFMLVNSGEPARGGAWLARSREIAEDHALQGAVAAFPDVIEARSLVMSGRVDDGLALATLKTLKATDQAGDLILDSGNRIEDDAQSAAPGSAPFLSASAMAANIQSQAMMQKMLAAMLRQEAARVAHENAVRKRDAILLAKTKQRISDFLKRR